MDNDCEAAQHSEAVQVVIGRRRSLQTFAVVSLRPTLPLAV
jgi:hypothetical protein